MFYDKKIQEEINHYKDEEIVHDLPPIYHYWSHRYLRPKFETLGFSDSNDFYIQYINRIVTERPEVPCEILSIGSGNCDLEIALANILTTKNINNYTFTCLDINPYMLERGKQLAMENRLIDHFNFLETDINNWNINKQYQVIVANQSLHHFLELEILFDKIYASLDDNGFFLSSDMIGRNGHMRWPEALDPVLALWSLLDNT